MGLKLSHVLGGVLELLGTNSATSRTITFPDKDMTVAGTNDVIGVNQTYQNLTASRAFSATPDYTNNTGKPIAVSVWSLYGASHTMSGFVDGEEVIQFHNGYNTGTNVYFIVPNGSTYNVTVTGSTLEKWVELR